jgi:hypothetical protein
MSQKMRALAAVGAFFFCTTAMACGSRTTTPEPITLASISVAPVTPFTDLGQQTLFVATATMNNGNTESVTAKAAWQSSNPNVLTIAPSGLATSVSEGEARVTATYEGIAGSVDVSVRIQWILGGRILSTADRSAVTSGVAIVADGAQSITYGNDGAYMLQGLGAPASKLLTINAAGYLTRNTTVTVNGTRLGVDLDLISLASPFSLTFYREFLRGAADNNGNLGANFRWEQNPNFYINTRNGSSDMAPSVVNELASLLPSIVTQVSNGRISAGRIETGTETRPITAGWINVDYTTAISSCGLAAVGGNRVQINPICSDLTTVGLHETTHALGFWHHNQTGGLMSRVAPDPHARGLSAIEAFHTKIAYLRPRGNTDPDNDPASAHLLGTPRTADAPMLACWPIR